MEQSTECKYVWNLDLLAAAIIKQAAIDYQAARRKQTNGRIGELIKLQAEKDCEGILDFFHSPLFSVITGPDFPQVAEFVAALDIGRIRSPRGPKKNTKYKRRRK